MGHCPTYDPIINTEGTMDRRSQILFKLRAAHGYLHMARARPNDSGDWVTYANRCISDARALMAEAPASTRRRWRVQPIINARKRDARVGVT
jgi:hypothetical protein